jgi:hypothetical protein
MHQEAESYRESDNKQKILIEAKNQVETFLYTMEHQYNLVNDWSETEQSVFLEMQNFGKTILELKDYESVVSAAKELQSKAKVLTAKIYKYQLEQTKKDAETEPKAT